MWWKQAASARREEQLREEGGCKKVLQQSDPQLCWVGRKGALQMNTSSRQLIWQRVRYSVWVRLVTDETSQGCAGCACEVGTGVSGLCLLCEGDGLMCEHNFGLKVFWFRCGFGGEMGQVYVLMSNYLNEGLWPRMARAGGRGDSKVLHMKPSSSPSAG